MLPYGLANLILDEILFMGNVGTILHLNLAVTPILRGHQSLAYRRKRILKLLLDLLKLSRCPQRDMVWIIIIRCDG